MAIAISSWKSSLHAYGICTCTEQPFVTNDLAHPESHTTYAPHVLRVTIHLMHPLQS